MEELWTISRGDGDGIDVYRVSKRPFSLGGMSDASLNGTFATKAEALEEALARAMEELLVARSRVRKLRARLRRAKASADAERG